ncbi:MAG: pitrilysin family protein [Thermodesulfobacteriota bacterium]
MNKIILLSLILSLGFLRWAGVPKLQAEGLDRLIEKRLPNGMDVLLLPSSKAPVVSVQVWYRVGSMNESAGKSGLAHLTEHLMFRGTEQYGPKQFSRIIQKNGGQDNAFTGRDYTAYFENLASDRLAVALDLESDRMTGLTVDKEKFTTENQVVQEERRLRVKDDPSASLFEEVIAAAFKSHPYQRPITGWMEDLEGLTHSDFLSFYRTYYQPGNATLVIAGDFKPENVFPVIEKTFGRIPGGPLPKTSPIKEPPQEADKRVVLRREAQLPYVVLTYHVPSFPHPDSFALEVMSQILAGGKSSRMYQKIVYQERMALEAGADYSFSSKDPFLFFFYAQAMPDQLPDKIEERLIKELEDWGKSPPGAEELERAKNQIEAAFIFAQDSIFFQANLLGKFHTLGNWKDLKAFLPGIRAVQQADLLRVYHTYFKDRNKTVGVLIPTKHSPGPESEG